MKSELEILTPTELLFFQKHIKLGRSHLERCLTETEIQKILHLGHIEKKAEKRVEADPAELSGNAMMMLNTILTTILGGWIGLSSFWGGHIDSLSVFWVVFALSLGAGTFIGYQNYELMRKSAKQSMEKRELQAVEIEALKVLNHKRRGEVKEKMEQLNRILHELHLPEMGSIPEEFNDHKLCKQWLSQLAQRIKQVPFFKERIIYPSILAEIEGIKASCSKEIAKDDQPEEKKRGMKEMLDKLNGTSIQPEHKVRSWIKANARQLLISLIPTVWGGFSSLLVYFTSPLDVAKNIGRFDLFYFLTQPYVKIIELVIAILITLYFTASFLYAQRKEYLRDQELKRAGSYITAQENELTLLDDNLLKLKAVLEVMERTWHLFHMVKKVEKVI